MVRGMADDREAANRYSITSGCWTAFQEARDSRSKVRREDAQPDLPDVTGNFTDPQVMDLKLFSRVHFPNANGAISMAVNSGLHPHFDKGLLTREDNVSMLLGFIRDTSLLQDRLFSSAKRSSLHPCFRHSDTRAKL